MKFKIDGKYFAIQSLKVIAAYMLGVFIVLKFLDLESPMDFVGTSSVVAIIFYSVFFFQRNIFIKDGIISFVEKNYIEKYKVKLADITNMEYEYKIYNTVTITTVSGREYKLHPKDAKALMDYLQSYRHNKTNAI